MIRRDLYGRAANTVIVAGLAVAIAVPVAVIGAVVTAAWVMAAVASLAGAAAVLAVDCCGQVVRLIRTASGRLTRRLR